MPEPVVSEWNKFSVLQNPLRSQRSIQNTGLTMNMVNTKTKAIGKEEIKAVLEMHVDGTIIDCDRI